MKKEILKKKKDKKDYWNEYKNININFYFNKFNFIKYNYNKKFSN